MSGTADQSGTAQATPAATRRAGRWIVRAVFYTALAAAVALAGIEWWAHRSYRATVADLRTLLESAKADVSLQDAQANLHGWYATEVEVKSFREDTTIRWKSIVGDYWVRLHATKKSKSSDKQYFTGLVTPDDPVPQFDRPKDIVPPPKEGPIGAKFAPTGRRKGAKKQTDD